MRLYLDANSKNHIGYTPDFLIIENSGNTYIYDVQGEIDYDPTRLACRVKGDLFIEKEDEDGINDYFELSEEDEKTLKSLLDDEKSEFKEEE